MAYFNTCDMCGANLDPGETCDCMTKREILRRKYEGLVYVPSRNQKEQQLVLNIKK